MLNYPPRGLVVNLVTPLTREGDPDAQALTRVIRRLNNEAEAVLVGSVTAGEALALGPQARIEVLAAAAGACQDKLGLFFDLTTFSEPDTSNLLDQAETQLRGSKSRPAVFYVLTPLIYRGNRDLPEHVRRLCRQTRRTFVIGNDPGLVKKLRPGPHHKNIRTSVLKKLADNEQVAGLVFEGRLSRALNYQRALKQRTGFRFYDGNEQNFLDRPSSSGVISCGAAVMPQAWADIVSSSLNLYDAQRLYPDHLSQLWQSGRAVNSLAELYRSNPPACLKTALALMKVIPRADLANGVEELEPNQIRQVEALLKELHLT
ncbi:MAG: dihydrodipicolinate synthase family protein [Pseudomonadota bacterium]